MTLVLVVADYYLAQQSIKKYISSDQAAAHNHPPPGFSIIAYMSVHLGWCGCINTYNSWACLPVTNSHIDGMNLQMHSKLKCYTCSLSVSPEHSVRVGRGFAG